MDKSQEALIYKAINSIDEVNFHNETDLIRKKSKNVYSEERNHFSSKPVDNSRGSSLVNITNESRMLEPEKESSGEDTTVVVNEIPDEAKVKKKTKRKPDHSVPHILDPNHPLARRPRPPKQAHEAASLAELTNVKIHRVLKRELRSKLKYERRECLCKTSSSKLYRATQHQVRHVLGKQTAVNALQFDDYFNRKNHDVETYPSFDQLQENLDSPDSSMDTFPRPWSVPLKQVNDRHDFVLEMLNELYKRATKDLKSVETRFEKKFGHLSKQDHKRKLQIFNTPSDSKPSQEKFTNEGQIPNSEVPRSMSFLSNVSGHASTVNAIDGRDSKTSETENTEEEYMTALLEDTHRNSQQAILSLHALVVGKNERRELEHLLERFWAIYESRKVKFNHSDFFRHSSARWSIFAKRVMDQAVRRLRINERNRMTYTHFLFPELKKKPKAPSILRQASTFPGHFRDIARIRGTIRQTTRCDTDSDVVDLVHEVEDQRKRIQKTNYDPSKTSGLSDKKTPYDIYKHPKEYLHKLRNEIINNPKFMKRIGKELALPQETDSFSQPEATVNDGSNSVTKVCDSYSEV